MTDDVFRLLVTGSRRIRDRSFVRDQLNCRLQEAAERKRSLVVVHGECPDEAGADRTADVWAREMARRGLSVRVESHPAQNHPTEDFGPWPGAGPRRNQHMVDLGADEVLAFMDRCTSMRCRRPDVHASHGTADCIRRAEAAGIPVERFELWRES